MLVLLVGSALSDCQNKSGISVEARTLLATRVVLPRHLQMGGYFYRSASRKRCASTQSTDNVAASTISRLLWTPAYNHSTCCPPSLECVKKDQYYSQCMYDNKTSSCSVLTGWCGGKGWSGPTCCIPGFECVADGSGYYSGCKPKPFCANARFGQCGGVDSEGHPWTKEYDHDTCCPEAFKCVLVNQYYSQCKWANSTQLAEA